MGYPESHADRTKWILERRGPKNHLDARRPYAFLWEVESDLGGALISTNTLFLTNKECPFRCLMCDLWQNTLEETVGVSDIPSQIDYALSQLPSASQIKLYNAGSFFDPKAIPPESDTAILERVKGYERVVVECHPAFIGDRCYEFADRLSGTLEVAMGLETVDPTVLPKLNKGMSLERFRATAISLRAKGIAVRAFILVRPPFTSEEEGIYWAQRSLDFCFEIGVEVACMIPTRAGNGAMESLMATSEYAPPTLRTLELAAEYGVSAGKARVYADTWDIDRFFDCDCSPMRAERLRQMNQTQSLPKQINCNTCGKVQE